MKKLIPQLLGGAPPKPTKTVYTVLRQLVQWIPSGMIQRLADEHRLDIRKWSAVSHVVALLYGQLAGCDSLNGIVDAARVHEGEWRNIRGAEPPKRNTFSNANRRRNADMAERLYWEVFGQDAGHHDSTRAETLCAGLKAGDVCVADRAYTDFSFLDGLRSRGVYFVVRQKKNMRFKRVRRLPEGRDGSVIADELVEPVLARSKALYPAPLRRVTARVEVDGKTVEMAFLTNNLEWSARTVAEYASSSFAQDLCKPSEPMTLQSSL